MKIRSRKNTLTCNYSDCSYGIHLCQRVFEHNALLIFHMSVKKVSLHNFKILLDMFPLVSLQNTVRNERSYNSHINQLGEDIKLKLANTQNPFHSVTFWLENKAVLRKQLKLSMLHHTRLPSLLCADFQL